MGRSEYPEAIGTYGKGEMNSNCRQLLETVTTIEMYLTNIQKHAEHFDKYGNVIRNPYRNQIDYILTRKQYKSRVTDSRSYSGISTVTDHRLVPVTLKREWYKAYPPKDNIITMNIGKLQEPKHRERYKKDVENISLTTPLITIISRRRNGMSTCIKTAEKVLGKKTSQNRVKMKM